jgi:hypothetical protein
MNASLSLPVAAELLVPHRLPIRVIEKLIEFNELQGVVESCLPPDSIFVHG